MFEVQSEVRITKKSSTKTAVSLKGVHYFHYSQSIFKLNHQIGIEIAFYSSTRQKWLCDTTYLEKYDAKRLFHIAVRNKLITDIPDILM